MPRLCLSPNWLFSTKPVRVGLRMEPPESPEGKKLKLGQRSFEKVNQPSTDPDPNSPQQILEENKQLDDSFDLPGIEREIWQQWRQRRMRDFKVFLALLILDGLCVGFAAKAHWSPYLSVPLISMAAMVTSATLWIVYVVNR